MPYKDPEKARERRRRFYEENRDRILTRSREWRAANLDRARARARAYKAANREARRAYEATDEARQLRLALIARSRKKIREQARANYRNNLDKKRAQARGYYSKQDREKRRLYRLNSQKVKDQERRRYEQITEIRSRLGVTTRVALVISSIEQIRREIDRMSPRQDAPPSKLAGANRINPGKGLHPGGKPSPSARVREAQQLVVSEEFGIAEDVVGESAPSARILARGVSNHGDMQAFLEALALDVVHGRVDHKTANFLLQTIRTRVGLWVQAQTFGAKLDIAPYREVDAKQLPSEATDSQ